MLNSDFTCASSLAFCHRRAEETAVTLQSLLNPDLPVHVLLVPPHPQVAGEFLVKSMTTLAMLLGGWEFRDGFIETDLS